MEPFIPDRAEAFEHASRFDRRALLKGLTAAGIGTATFRRALAAAVQEQGGVTPEMIQKAEWIAGLELTEEERQSAAKELQGTLAEIKALRAVKVGRDVPPALLFQPEVAPVTSPILAGPVRRNQAVPTESAAPRRPESDEVLAFLPVSELAALIRTRQISSTELTKLYLARLKRYDPMLRCVVTLTEERALAQAGRADAEIAAGRYRGPLHGIPWGAKDLIAVPGSPTGWGAPQFKDQTFDTPATVAARLDEAGAVLVAKLSLGALAMGDKWYGGLTRSPWDPRRGSSGSSAGSASAVAAGLVGFALGSETLGSIVSPCRACGSTGLRPTFGRVSRAGCMPLAWSMDKIGPITRSVEDCALVFDAIHGADGLDLTAVDRPFAWPAVRPVRGLRVGYLERKDHPTDQRPELKVLRELGATLVPIKLPEDVPARPLVLMLTAECATVFDDLTRAHVTEGLNEWPATFREGQFVTAVDYLRAAQVRTLLQRSMARLFETVDLYVGHAEDLVITNFTGHPTVVLPDTFEDRNGRPAPESLLFTGKLFDESTLLAIAHAYQQATGTHLKRPPLDTFLAEHEKAQAEEKAKAAAEKAAGAKDTKDAG